MYVDQSTPLFDILSINQSLTSGTQIYTYIYETDYTYKVQIDMYNKKGLTCMYGWLQTLQFCYLVERIL